MSEFLKYTSVDTNNKHEQTYCGNFIKIKHWQKSEILPKGNFKKKTSD